MEKKVNILVVEDEAIVAMALADKLEAEGYSVVGIANNGLKAIELFEQNQVDLLLCDINIKGDWDGIQTVTKIIAIRPIPVIYLTAFSDVETVERAKKTFPAAYVTKPYNIINLRIAIDMAIHNFVERINPEKKPSNNVNFQEKENNKENILQIDNHVFIKQGYQFVKVALNDILILEADDIYTTFITTEKKYAFRMSLTNVLEKLNFPRMARIHRSFAINTNHINSFNDFELVIGNHTVPIGKSYKADFMKIFGK
jgi:two-component system, response regulator PdtaR